MSSAAAAEVPASGPGGGSDDALPARAAAGGAQAWDLLVERHTRLLWAIARGHGLSTTDAADTVLTTWSLLAQQLDRIRDRSRVGTWLATTARREALRRLTRHRPEHINTTGHDTLDRVDPAELGANPHAALQRALDLLPPQQRLLLHVVSAEPRPTADQISAALNMPVSEIQPARAHALRRLRQLLAPADVRQ